ncbi:MAG TPA: glycerophosphodiester phosphodiesterase [Candidatus Deferrimicrobium sp.]|nr:glycerophosphodiester phosphodiesterase [Candidatus Deferrimicrobium sp.]
MSNLLILGHRGASSLAPENTLPAFNLAAHSGAQIELDVQLSKDGQVVVIHDERLERTTNGKGFVGNHTLAELKQLDAGSWFSEKYAGTSIPTLDEVFTTLPNKVSINIELKTNFIPYTGIEQKVIESVKRHKAMSRVLISSFNWESLTIAHRLEAKLKLGLLFDNIQPQLWSKARLLNVYSIHPLATLLSPDLVWQSHSWGYHVLPWVVNSRKRMLKLKSMGVDGFFTDCPQIFSKFEASDATSF